MRGLGWFLLGLLFGAVAYGAWERTREAGSKVLPGDDAESLTETVRDRLAALEARN